MLGCFLLVLLAVSGPARGGEPGASDLSDVDDARHAEYQRLRDDLRTYAQRETWAAVERIYQRCLSLYPEPSARPEGGWPPPTPIAQRDHLHAAHAAQARGDMSATRQRLVRALRKEESREVVDWLWGIDTTYSRVVIQASEGSLLAARARPFDITQGRAIDFAAAALAETGRFDGLVPRGTYTVDGQELRVVGGVGVVELTIDPTESRRARKARRKAERR